MTKILLQDQLEHYEIALSDISSKIGLGMCKAIESAMKYSLSRTYNSDIYFNPEEHTVFYYQSLLVKRQQFSPYFFPLSKDGQQSRIKFLQNCINKCKELIKEDGN